MRDLQLNLSPSFTQATLLSSVAQSYMYVSCVVVTKAFDFVFPGTLNLTLQELKSATVGGVFLPTYLTSSPEVQDFIKPSIRGMESPCSEFRTVCWKGSFLVPVHQSLRNSSGTHRLKATGLDECFLLAGEDFGMWSHKAVLFVCMKVWLVHENLVAEGCLLCPRIRNSCLKMTEDGAETCWPWQTKRSSVHSFDPCFQGYI